MTLYRNQNTGREIPNSELIQYLREFFRYDNGKLIHVETNQVREAKYANGYKAVNILSAVIPAQKAIWMFHNGDIPDGFVVDHVNRIRDDNRIDNLRLATGSQNRANRRGNRSPVSGYRGVHLRHKRWGVHISHEGKLHHIGTFDCPHDAAEAYNKAATELKGAFALLNIIKRDPDVK